ncbi:MAG TPA: 3'-5' exonuclease [Edaphocola sp.]|nr:3'-5' exonuclease [Edaphocola sp.]
MELIIDIETVSNHKDFEEISSPLKKQWERKASFLRLSETEQLNPHQSYFNHAGIYAEFGKIICIGIGFVQDKEKQIRIKMIANHNEKALILEFFQLIIDIEKKIQKPIILCGHNIKEFDLPYICRRALVHGIPLPKSLKLSGLKPWQILHQDTLELWRFGDYKHYTSLDLLAQILNIPSSKTDIDGSEVNNVYWNENDLQRISDYCAKDIFTTALVYLRLSRENFKYYDPIYIS